MVKLGVAGEGLLGSGSGLVVSRRGWLSGAMCSLVGNSVTL